MFYRRMMVCNSLEMVPVSLAIYDTCGVAIPAISGLLYNILIYLHITIIT